MDGVLLITRKVCLILDTLPGTKISTKYRYRYLWFYSEGLISNISRFDEKGSDPRMVTAS